MSLLGVVVGIVLALSTGIPVAWRWGLGGRSLLALVALAGAVGAAVGLWQWSTGLPTGITVALIWLVTTLVAAGLLLYRFYRDPERAAPGRDDVLVSPADGVVCYVRRTPPHAVPVASKRGHDYLLEELRDTALGEEPTLVIGISMSFLDVHVNRAPFAGALTLQRRQHGGFGSLRDPEMILKNSRVTTVIQDGSLEAAVVQISSRLVRHIATFVRAGDAVQIGQRIGVIRFGSQVDLVLPCRPDVRVTVRSGQRVRAGETIVALRGGEASRPEPAS